MKKLKFLFTFVLLALVCMMSTTMTSCNNRGSKYQQALDSLSVQRTCKSIMNGASTDANEFTKLAITECTRCQFVEITSNLECDVITTIAECVIKKDGVVTYDTFIREYLSNQNIYDIQNEVIKDVNRSYNSPKTTIDDHNELKDTINN